MSKPSPFTKSSSRKARTPGIVVCSRIRCAAVGWRCRDLGDAAGAVADTRRALGLYDGLAARSGEEWFETACCHAALEGLAGRPGSGVSAAEVSEHVARSMALLRKAVGLGYRNASAFRIESALRAAARLRRLPPPAARRRLPGHAIRGMTQRPPGSGTIRADRYVTPGRMPFDRASEAHDESLPNRLDPGPRAAHSRCIDSFGAAPDRLLRRGSRGLCRLS